MFADVTIHDSYITVQPAAEETLRLWFLGGWIAVFGAVVGSFLNVVIFRLPLGLSVSHPGSRCPECKHPIRWHDNVPVFGWLLLGGRCRDCRAKISARYPLVEAFVAALFVWTALCDVFWGGAWAAVNATQQVQNVPLAPGLPWQQFGYHLLLLCTLVCLGLIDFDDRDAPPRLCLPALVVGLALPLVSLGLRPLHANQTVQSLAANRPVVAALFDGLAGLAMGAVLGCLVASASPRREGSNSLAPAAARRIYQIVAAPSLLGIFLGWQAVCWVVIGGILLYGVACSVATQRNKHLGGPVISVCLVGCLLAPAWSLLIEAPSWQDWLTASYVPLTAVALAVAAGFLRRRQLQPG